MGSKEFKDLQAKWYRKLAEKGFNDIEKDEEVVRFHGQYFQGQYTPEKFIEKKEYFEKAKELLNEDIFLDQVEKKIWTLHANGVSIRSIVGALKKEHVDKNKNQVNEIINEFQELMFK